MKILKNKKIIAIILACVITITLIALTLFVIPFPLDFAIDAISPMENNVVYVDNGEELPFLYKQENGQYSDEDFKIVSFTDIHLSGTLMDRKKNMTSVNMLKKNIETEKPDLVIVTGDIVTYGYTEGRMKKLAEMFDKYKLYWAPVLGNHDAEGSTAPTREELSEILESYEYCLFKKGDTEGYGNYIINIKSSETLVSQSLIFMDSGNYLPKDEIKSRGLDRGKTQYAYIKPAQIQWYKESVADLKAKYGADAKSMLFIHIPLPEYLDAYEKGEIIYGEKRESVCSSNHNSGMFDAILEMGSTKAIFAGHDHINDYNALYMGVNFVYTQPSGYGTYDLVSKFKVEKDKRLQGCTIIMLKSDSSFSLEQKFNTRF